MVRALCALVLAALLSGCSAVRLVYDNADIYVRWRAAHYLDPDETMAEELDERIAAYMAWHRTHSLPKYAQIADEARRRMERQLQPDDLVWGYDSVVAQLREDMRAAAESMAPLLDRLTPRQIAHFERRLAEDNRRFARENLRGGERERRKRRTERNVERLEDWLGRLSRAQVERVAQYSERAPLLDDLRHRLHRADLVVGETDRDQGDAGTDRVGIGPGHAVHRRDEDVAATRLHPAGGTQRGLVLCRPRDQGPGHAKQGEVDRLGPGRHEGDLGAGRSEGGGGGVASPVESGAGCPPLAVRARRVARWNVMQRS